ncbi:MAG: gliding motility protein GldN [Flavobacteriales bacterium]|nr:gliding motility protein GldN [Flavobacteriales bacterium]|tara:strand:- start:1751 stop:2617 length:867 start_codon:yes stop_codon:yes gene_type:complete
MKNLVFIITIICFTQFSFAQDILDGAYKKDIRDGSNERLIQPYQHVREADVMWSTKIERVIDLREKMNQVFYYPLRPINDRQNLIDVLVQAIKEGTLTAYGNASNDDEFQSPMSPSEVENIGLNQLGLQPMFVEEIEDPETGDAILDTTYNDFSDYAHDVKKYRVKEEWFFDKQRSVMEVRIIGICPVIDRRDEDGIYTGETSLFWVYFPEARKILSKAEVFNHRKNDAARLTYDDIFHKRFFSSRIVKESNKYDRKISEYKEGIDALLEAEKIKEEIFNLEHDLWEY